MYHILVKEGLKDDDLITRLNESHKGAQHSYNRPPMLELATILSTSLQSIQVNSPSLAPVVMVTSVSGLIFRPQKGE